MRPIAMAVLGVLACNRAEPPADSGALDTTAAAAAAEETSVVEIAQRHFDAVPDSVLLRRGACPFECCVYREWRADTDIPLRARPSDDADSVHALAAGERFTADSGDVRITGPAIVAVSDTVTGPGDAVRFMPGDTFVVLDYLGEGRWNVYHRDRVVGDVAGFWGAEFDGPSGAYYGDYRKEWWVHATAGDNRAGWFRADTTFRYSGADACSGPM